MAEGLDARTCRTNPIRCRVTGGYTISKQSGYGADSSPETLLTCILQVRLVCCWQLPSPQQLRTGHWSSLCCAALCCIGVLPDDAFYGL